MSRRSTSASLSTRTCRRVCCSCAATNASSSVVGGVPSGAVGRGTVVSSTADSWSRTSLSSRRSEAFSASSADGPAIPARNFSFVAFTSATTAGVGGARRAGAGARRAGGRARRRATRARPSHELARQNRRRGPPSACHHSLVDFLRPLRMPIARATHRARAQPRGAVRLGQRRVRLLRRRFRRRLRADAAHRGVSGDGPGGADACQDAAGARPRRGDARDALVGQVHAGRGQADDGARQPRRDQEEVPDAVRRQGRQDPKCPPPRR